MAHPPNSRIIIIHIYLFICKWNQRKPSLFVAMLNVNNEFFVYAYLRVRVLSAPEETVSFSNLILRIKPFFYFVQYLMIIGLLVLFCLLHMLCWLLYVIFIIIVLHSFEI